MTMVKRRRVLQSVAGVGVGGVAIAGGSRFLGWAPFGIGLPDAAPLPGEPPATPPPLECNEDEMQRVQQEFEEAELRYGEARSSAGIPAFRLYADKQKLSRGETVNITLENVSSAPKPRGAKTRNNLQVLTTEGWQDVRVWTPGSIPPHPRDETSWPGDTLNWSITMAEGDVSAAFVFMTELEVCPRLPSGRYRFVFAGLNGTDGAVGVQFDLVE